MQISFAVTAKLISAFVFATRIVQFLFYLNPKFQASSSFLSLYRPVCVRPGRKPRRPVFSRRGSFVAQFCLFYKIVNGLVAVPFPDYMQPIHRISRYSHSMTFRQFHTGKDYYKYLFFSTGSCLVEYATVLGIGRQPFGSLLALAVCRRYISFALRGINSG